MFNDHLYFKIHQSRHAELIRQGEAQRLAESLVPKNQKRLSSAASVVSERLGAWQEGIRRYLRDAFTREQPSISDSF